MNSTEYVHNKIDQLVEKFRLIKCSYEYDKMELTHNIEVLPLSFFDKSSDLSAAIERIYCEFFDLFPYEGLFFISSDAVLPVRKPTYVKQGDYYSIMEWQMDEKLEPEMNQYPDITPKGEKDCNKFEQIPNSCSYCKAA